jgi:tetratricopeptide (TPR) repeat protein
VVAAAQTVVAAAGAPAAPPAADTGEMTVTCKSAEAVNEIKAAQALLDNQRIDEGEVHVRKALTLDPDCAQANILLAEFTEGDESAKLSAHAHEQSGALPPAERDWVESRVELSAGHEQRSDELLKSASDAAPKDKRLLRTRIGRAMGRDWSQVAEMARQLIALDPKNPQAQNDLAYAELNLGHPDAAIAAAQKQADLIPDEPNAHDTLGEILMGAGKLPEARAEFEKALQKSPKFAIAQEGVAFTYAYAHDWKSYHASMLVARNGMTRPADVLENLQQEKWGYAAEGNLKGLAATADAIDATAAKAGLSSSRPSHGARAAMVFAVIGKPADAARRLAMAADAAKAAHFTGTEDTTFRFDVLSAQLFSAWKQHKGADAAKAYAGLEAQVKETPNAVTERNLRFARSLVALAKGDKKGAAYDPSECFPGDAQCRFVMAGLQRDVGDKAAGTAALAQLKATPKRSGWYLYYWATSK